jgi:TPR repeat protein
MRCYCKKFLLMIIPAALLSLPASAEEAPKYSVAPMPPKLPEIGRTHKYTREELSELRALSEKGDAEAQEKLGSLYAEGYSVDKNVREAVKWWKKAAAQGNPEAEYELGIAHHEGLGGLAKSDKKALEWFRKAAEHGEPRAELNVGIAYYNGIGVEKDVTEAMKWFQLAARDDIAQAQYILAAGYYKGVGGLPMDRAKAYIWMKQAVENGSKDAKEDMPGLEEGLTPLERERVNRILGDP